MTSDELDGKTAYTICQIIYVISRAGGIDIDDKKKLVDLKKQLLEIDLDDDEKVELFIDDYLFNQSLLSKGLY